MAKAKKKDPEYIAMLAGFEEAFKGHQFTTPQERTLALRAYQHGALNHMLYVADASTEIHRTLSQQGIPPRDITASIAAKMGKIVEALSQ